VVRAWRRVDRIEEQEREERRHAGRYLRLYTDEDRSSSCRRGWRRRTGAALSRALDAAGEKLYGEVRARRAAAGAGTAGDARGAGAGAPARIEETSAEQRRADALGLIAESALAGGLDPGSRGDRYQVRRGAAPAEIPASPEVWCGR
jgi:hypothetical protein